MFIDDKESVDVMTYYKKTGHDYEAYTAKEFSCLKLQEDDKKSYNIVKIKAAVLTWGLYNELQEASLLITDAGDRQFNYRLYKENRLTKMIKEWDAKDKEGKPVPVNEKTILHLSPVVAEAILRALDELSFVGEEEENLS